MSTVIPRIREWLPQTLVTGIAGLLGAAVGAAATGYVQYRLERQKDVYAAQQQRLEHAEQILTLIGESPEAYLGAKRDMFLSPLHMFKPPGGAEHVLTLVTLYFPRAENAARAYEADCAGYVEGLTEIAMSIGRHQPVGTPGPDQAPYCKMMADGDLVISEVMKELHKPYTMRGVNVAACIAAK